MDETFPNILKNSNANDNDGGLANDDLPLIGVNRGIKTVERISELLSRYGVPSEYVYRISITNEYVSTLGLLKIGVCEESFWAKF